MRDEATVTDWASEIVRWVAAWGLAAVIGLVFWLAAQGG